VTGGRVMESKKELSTETINMISQHLKYRMHLDDVVLLHSNVDTIRQGENFFVGKLVFEDCTLQVEINIPDEAVKKIISRINWINQITG
jgi:hypothetical protein